MHPDDDNFNLPQPIPLPNSLHCGWSLNCTIQSREKMDAIARLIVSSAPASKRESDFSAILKVWSPQRHLDGYVTERISRRRQTDATLKIGPALFIVPPTPAGSKFGKKCSRGAHIYVDEGALQRSHGVSNGSEKLSVLTLSDAKAQFRTIAGSEADF